MTQLTTAAIESAVALEAVDDFVELLEIAFPGEEVFRFTNQAVEILKDADGFDREDDYGNPIPGLGELGVTIGSEPARPARLTDLPQGGPTAVVIKRMAEHVQADTDLIGRFREAGVVPDARVSVTVQRGGVVISVAGHEDFELPDEMAHAVFVETV